MLKSQLLKYAEEWASSAIDEQDALITRDLIRKTIAKDESAHQRLVSMFSGPLRFGTAGLRAPIGAGESRMNTSVVARASWGFAAWLKGRGATTIAVGFDARRNSLEFAQVASEVFSAAGLEVYQANGPAPTPVLAFGVRHLEVDAGVMITASHNPRKDNGYKVYLEDGSQIAPPIDSQISALIEQAPTARQIARDVSRVVPWPSDLFDSYVRKAAELASDQDISCTWVYTPMHGVGYHTLQAVVATAGFPQPIVVPEQIEPDPAFPTLEFPNPEESGALNMAYETANRAGAELIIANDPDADRCAVAVPTSQGWCQLTGDEVGALLAWWVINVRQRGSSRTRDNVLASTIVSSTLSRAIALSEGYGFEQTLTGFKWISRVKNLVYGYEEALGYCVDPENVRDKDGITAAIAIISLHLFTKRQNTSLSDLLDDIFVTHGLHFTDNRSTRFTDTDASMKLIADISLTAPTHIGRFQVSHFEDLAHGVDGLPPTAGVRFFLDGSTRLILRPSGTEAKIKAYLEIILPTSRSSLARDKVRAKTLANEIHQALTEFVLCPAP